MPFLPSALKRIACVGAAWVVACNAITGVNDLEVAEGGCTPGEYCPLSGCEGGGVQSCDETSTCVCENIASGNGGSSDVGLGGDGGSSSSNGGRGGSGNLGGGGTSSAAGAGGSGAGGSGAMGGTGASGCTPGDVRECSLAAGAQGIQVCSADGASYGLCTALQVAPRSVGIRCTQNSQCALGLTCSTSSMTNGAQGGYCTRTCADDTSCQGIDPESYCYLDSHYCLARCQTDVGDFELPDLTTKCQGRPELACFPVSGTPSPDSQEGICLPVCQSDADCGGRYCNLYSGGCEDIPPVGAPVGAACTLASDCAGGVCQPFGPTAHFCTGACSQLEVGGCGFAAGVAPGQRQAACVDITATNRYRDINLCLELCDTAADCAQVGWQCSRNGQFASQWGRIGFCTPPNVLCSNRCLDMNGGDSDETYAADNECDDGGPGNVTSLCQLGTDCADCGVRIP